VIWERAKNSLQYTASGNFSIKQSGQQYPPTVTGVDNTVSFSQTGMLLGDAIKTVMYTDELISSTLFNESTNVELVAHIDDFENVIVNQFYDFEEKTKGLLVSTNSLGGGMAYVYYIINTTKDSKDFTHSTLKSSVSIPGNSIVTIMNINNILKNWYYEYEWYPNTLSKSWNLSININGYSK
jgi:hypothetical protein